MKSLQIVFFFFIFTITSPLLLVFAIFLVLCRSLVFIWLKCRYLKRFKGFLEGKDALWTANITKIKGVVNILAFIKVERSDYDPASSALILLTSLRNRFSEKLLQEDSDYEKLFYKRKSCMGYQFWLKDDPGGIDKYIRTFDFRADKQFITLEVLTKVMGYISNAELPDEHTRGWELLVGTKPLNAAEGLKFPVSKTHNIHQRDKRFIHI